MQEDLAQDVFGAAKRHAGPDAFGGLVSWVFGDKGLERVLVPEPSARRMKNSELDGTGLQDGQRIDVWPNLMAGTAVFKFQRSR